MSSLAVLERPSIHKPISIDHQIIALAPDMREKMMEHAMDNSGDYFSGEELTIDWYSVFEKLTPSFIDDLDNELFGPVILHEEHFMGLLWNEVESRPQYFRNIEAEMVENRRDLMEYQRDPLAYNGMSQSDFI